MGPLINPSELPDGIKRHPPSMASPKVRENVHMDQKSSEPGSLRNPLAALSNAFRRESEQEIGQIRLQRRRESRKCKELALQEKPPKRQQDLATSR